LYLKSGAIAIKICPNKFARTRIKGNYGISVRTIALLVY
jgi:hypothetical protein